MLVAAVVVSSCGDPGSVDRAASSGEDQVTETIVGITADSVGMAFDRVIPADLGGVRIDDPLPPQADAITDPAVAEAAVRFAYQHWILVDLDPDLRAKLIENGEATAEGMANGFEAARSVVEYARIQVDTVTFPEADRAQLTFRIQWNDNPSPYFPNPMVGEAVYRDGTWRVTRRVLCLLAIGTGQDCAGQGPNPTSPPSFTVAAPDGFDWDGYTAPPGIVGTDGTPATWSGDGQVMIWASAVVGASAVDSGDVAQILSAMGRFGESPGSAIDVGRFPGQFRDEGSTVRLVFLRDDDVIVDVQLMGDRFTIDDALAIAATMSPSDVVSVPLPVMEDDGSATATTAGG